MRSWRLVISTMLCFGMTACLYEQKERSNPFDPAGSTYGSRGIWGLTRIRGNAGTLTVDGIAADGFGNIYVCGNTGSILDGQSFGGGISDAFLVKFDHKGNWVWTRLVGEGGDDAGQGIAVDDDGYVYIVGNTTGTIDGQVNSGGYDFFIAKYSPNGSRLWTRMRGSVNNDTPYDVKCSGGAIYICGSATGAIDGQPYNTLTDLAVMKFKRDGGWLWTRMRGTTTADDPKAIAVSGDAVYVALETSASFDAQPSSALIDICYVKFDTDGNWIYTRQRGTANNDNVGGIAVDSRGDVYIAASVSSSLDGQPYAGSSDPALLKYDAAGNWQWTRMRGSASPDDAKGVAIDARDAIYFAGAASGAFDGQTHGGGSQDAYICAFSPDGQWKWTRLRGLAGSEYATAVVVDAAGDAIMAGGTSGAFDGQSYSGGTDLFYSKFE